MRNIKATRTGGQTHEYLKKSNRIHKATESGTAIRHANRDTAIRMAA